MEVIKGHHIFTAIETQSPLPINEGGQQAVFNQSECTMVLEDSKRRYPCAGNFFWQNSMAALIGGTTVHHWGGIPVNATDAADVPPESLQDVLTSQGIHLLIRLLNVENRSCRISGP